MVNIAHQARDQPKHGFGREPKVWADAPQSGADPRKTADAAVRGLCDRPDLPVMALPVQVAGVDGAVGRNGHIVGLIEFAGMKACLDRGPGE
jgi:hypothetical protein